MHIAGVQPVGAKGFASVQGVVSDARMERAGTSTSALEGGRTAQRAPHTVTAEPVVFPREQRTVDQRPVHLRQQKAAARYRDAQDDAPGRPRLRRRL